MTIIIPEIPQSNNKYIGRENRWGYQAEKKRWEMLIRAACAGKVKRTAERAVVQIRYTFPDRRRRDPDNYSGKMILDGLVRCGVIRDDSFGNIRLELSAGYAAGKPKTEIIVNEVM